MGYSNLPERNVLLCSRNKAVIIKIHEMFKGQVVMMYCEFSKEIVNLNNDRQFAEVQTFLASFDLTFDRDVEYTILLRAGDQLVATGSFQGEVLRNIAVDETMQGCGLTATVVSELMQEQARRGRFHYFIFTKPRSAHLFTAIGFTEIARAEPYVALLETGAGSVQSYCADILKEISHLPPDRAAVVVNCNPFTKGHRALIEQAARENPAVIVFVVSEDRSLFPFAHRFRLVKEGVADLANVAVVPAGKYMVSVATFPTYFTRDEDKVTAQTALDITLFATQIAPRLGIKARYIGDEPYCSVTNCYNQSMLDIFPRHGIQPKLIQRVELDGQPISASKVRALIKTADWEGIRRLVPDVTYAYLQSEEAQAVLEKIRTSDSRH